ncbi:uncharacterized protein LOC113214374 [Frankliniella occidentalis]|uniref:Uncharacterized protein LOC113214374 n=1 Tax=Frankliniella occidentalis TaxID=133901 RepID=A0A6J1TCS0_FRAOC|nr:uncharacterized protein LOC113214374 [Frankliniella occidentalis]
MVSAMKSLLFIVAIAAILFTQQSRFMVMEPPGSPVSSPIKSPASSLRPSPVSSPIRSAPSSPIKSVTSSPLRSPQQRSPFSVTPFGLSQSPFQDSESGDTNLFQQLHAKRQKLDSIDNSQAKCSHSGEEENTLHCRQLFSENVECSMSSEANGAINEQEEQEGSNLVFFENNGQASQDNAEDNSEQVFGGMSQERQTSSSTSCYSSSSSESSSEDSSSESSDEGQNSEASEASSSNCEDSDSSHESDQEHNTSDESDSDFFSPQIHEGCKLTEDEGVLLLMDMFTNCKLSKKQMGGILKCILKFIPEGSNFPKTEYSLFEYVKKLCPIPSEKIHYYCSVCYYYLGTVDMNCTICSSESNKFFQIPLAEQIQNLFENHGLADLIDKYQADRANSDANGGYSDLLDGSEFKRVHVDGQYNLDLLGHTDGISVSLSSFVSLWPLEWVISQLPPYLRFKFVLVNGIWLDESKPYMNTFLKPFTKELQDLRINGVTWTHPRTKVVHKSYISAPCFCADAPARAMLQNILAHGGKHCCQFCEQKMKKLPAQPVVLGEKKKSRRRVFTFKENCAKLRTSERMQKQGSEARNRQRVTASQQVKAIKGVRGPSEVTQFPGCDRSTVVYPEYMHLLMCVLKEFMRLWFEVDGPWSLKAHRDMMNAFLKSISVPDFITRIPRSTEHFTKWKANEFRSFLLFFSLIILSQCMKKEYFQHWTLLVSAFYLLLQDFVSETDVAKANLLLRMFCRSFPVLYKHEFYTYYIHQLCHLGLTVQRYGPLHTNSAFMFESFNGTLAKYIHGTKNQGKELVNNINIAFGVEILRTRTFYGTSATQNHIDFKNQIQGFDFRPDLEILHSCGIVQEPFKAFYRAIRRHEKFTCSLYSRQKKRNNYTVCFLTGPNNDKNYGAIKYFCQSADNKQVAIVERFEVDHLNTFCHDDSGVVIEHIIPVLPTNVTQVIDLSAILFKVIRVANYVCLRPNKHEYNL